MDSRILPLICLIGAASPAAAQACADKTPSITVTGTSELQLQPDQIDFLLTLSTRRPTLGQAESVNEQDSKATLKRLQDAGIDPKDLNTSAVNLEPGYVKDKGQQAPDYFEVSRVISVRLRKADALQGVLDQVYRNGTVEVSQLAYSASTSRARREEVRLQAIQAGKAKAESMAKALGVKVGRVLSVTEEHPWGGNPASNSYSVDKPGDDAGQSTPLGKVTISESVSLTFALE